MILRKTQSNAIAIISNVTAYRWHVVLLSIFVVFSSHIQLSYQFSMQEYRPPVKTSVKKIHSDRTSAIIHNHGDMTGSSTSSHHTSAVMRTEQQQQKRDNTNSPPSSYRRRFLSASSKAAHAGNVALSSSSQSPISFESRMRDLVLGRQREEAAAIQQQQQHELYQEQQHVVTIKNSDRQRGAVPSNVKIINSVQDYKEIVGEEHEKPVIVRFFATYCKVCICIFF
jgi:tRNA U34 5-carboxymethylaminomethyl modifying GTPase MnmE/TrmE